MLDKSKHVYILGLPITTPIGQAHPIYIKDYEEMSKHIGALYIDTPSVIGMLRMLSNSNEDLRQAYQPFLDMAGMMDIWSFINVFKNEDFEGTFLHELYVDQKKLFDFIFKDDVFDKIESLEEFEGYRELIIEMNDIDYEPPNPNPELARLDKLKAKLQEMKGENITFDARYTTVLMHSAVPPNDLTIYQFNKAFERVSHFKSYETTTLFSTVDTSGKVKIEPWYGMNKKEKPATITQDQLDRARELQKSGGLASNL